MGIFEFSAFWVAVSFVVVLLLIILKGKNALLKSSYDKIDALQSKLEEIELVLSETQNVAVDLDNEYAKLTNEVDEKLRIVHDSAVKLKNSIDHDLEQIVAKIEKDYDLREKGFRRSVIESLQDEIYDALSKNVIAKYQSGNVSDKVDVAMVRKISNK